jgi:DNA mismatch endonuclease (patch repair protein)
VRRELHRRGLRYRVELSVLPGVRRRADVVFTRAKVAVFIDGCFWHRCPIHATSPKANAAFWAEKLTANQARDRDTDQRLLAIGWRVVRVWEHEDPVAAAQRIADVVMATPQRSEVTHSM